MRSAEGKSRVSLAKSCTRVRILRVEFDETYADVRVGVEPGVYAGITVSDSGPGMSEEIAERAFEPFFTTKPAGKGTGLGLSTCYGIVRQAGGQIWIYSEEGRGTSVKFVLPLSDSAAAVEAPAPIAPEGGDELVLVAEDNMRLRGMLKRVLRRAGYRVLEAADGVDALRVADEAQSEIDLLVTDITMPNMGGIELAKTLHGGGRVPAVLFLSGYASTDFEGHEGLPAQIRFLPKPFAPRDLLAAIRAALSP